MQDETCEGQFGHLMPVAWHGGYFGFDVRDNGFRDCVLTFREPRGHLDGPAQLWVTRALEAALDPSGVRWPFEVSWLWRVAAGRAQAEGAHRAARAYMAQAHIAAGDVCEPAPHGEVKT